MENSIFWTSEVFFERLDCFLTARNWTMHQLCSGADLSVDSMYKMRSRHALPSFQSICIICDALGVSLSDFFEIKNADPDRAVIVSSFDAMSKDTLAVLALLVKCLK